MIDLEAYCIAVLKSENILFKNESSGDVDDIDGKNSVISFSITHNSKLIPVILTVHSHSIKIAYYAHKFLLSCRYSEVVPQDKQDTILEFIGKVNDYQTSSNEAVRLHFNFDKRTIGTQLANIFGYKLYLEDVKLILHTLLVTSVNLYEKCGPLLTKIISGDLTADTAFSEFKKL